MGYPKGKKLTPEHKAKIKAAHAERLKDPAMRAKMMANLAIGWASECTPERNAKISRAMTGKPKSDEHRARLRDANLGKQATEETKAKMRAAIAARKARGEPVHFPMSPEGRAKQLVAVTGRVHPPEERAKRAASLQASWNRRGNRHSPETREKMRAARARMVLPMQDTSIELAVHAILDNLGVEYVKHAPIDELLQHQFDVAMPQCLALIEVDGCYWHACERCYPDPERRAPRMDNLYNDKMMTAAATAMGWRVLRVAEHDVKEGRAAALVEAFVLGVQRPPNPAERPPP